MPITVVIMDKYSLHLIMLYYAEFHRKKCMTHSTMNLVGSLNIWQKIQFLKESVCHMIIPHLSQCLFGRISYFSSKYCIILIFMELFISHSKTNSEGSLPAVSSTAGSESIFHRIFLIHHHI
jgi:hypothetical protein